MYKLLLVDDEPLILNGLKNLIDWESLDIEISGEASCGKDALDLLVSQPFDILITDIRMSYMNGLELIAEMRRLNMSTRIIILSGYDDFTYIKEAVKFGIENYLLKPVSQSELLSTLMTVLQKIETNLYHMDMLKSNFLIRWMHNTIEKEELLDKAAFLNIDLGCKNYAVILLKVFNKNAHDKLPLDSTVEKRYELENIILKKFRDIGNPLLFKDLDGDYALCISDFNQEQYEIICNKILPSCIRNIQSYTNMSTFIAVGSIETSYQSVNTSYSSAKKLLDYRLVMPMKMIVTHLETYNNASTSLNLLQLDYNALKNYILLKNIDQITLWIDGLFQEISEKEYIDLLMLQNLVLEILFFAISTIKSIDSTMNVLNDYPNLYMNVLKLGSFNDFSVWLKATLADIIDVMIITNKKNSSLIGSISAYIQENYNKNINLDTIAAEFDKNPAYIGQLFKKEFGQSFTNYINGIRIERAKELLTNQPNLTTMEISAIVGYYNTNYFYTVFKKLTGETPSDFKTHLY